MQTLGHERELARLIGQDHGDAMAGARYNGGPHQAAGFAFLTLRTVLFNRGTADVRKGPAGRNIGHEFRRKCRARSCVRKAGRRHRNDQCEGRQ